MLQAEIIAELRTNAGIAKGHPNIVQYENVIETKDYIFVLMELVGRSATTRGVDLFDFLVEERDGAWVSEPFRGRADESRPCRVYRCPVHCSDGRGAVSGRLTPKHHDCLPLARGVAVGVCAVAQVSEDEARGLFRQLVGALKHLHDNDVVHGDIKPDNAMVILPINLSSAGTEPLALKLIDFGCASFLRRQHDAADGNPGSDRPARGGGAADAAAEVAVPTGGKAVAAVGVGPIFDNYSPPEVFNGRLSCVGFPVDMYRLGATLYTMLQKCPPSHEVPRADRRRGVFNQRYRWTHLSPSCRDLVSALLHADPDHRPTCAQVLAHPWLSPPGTAAAAAAPAAAGAAAGAVAPLGSPVDGVPQRRSTRTTPG